jgi:hypothetical protein
VPPPPAGCTFSTSTSKARVLRNGQVTLTLRIRCSHAGGDGRASVLASLKRTKLGRSSFKIKSGGSAAVRFKLTKSARTLLLRRKHITARVAITVTRGRSVTKTYSVRLNAPT